MICVGRGLWVGDSKDGCALDEKIDGVLNVAQDLRSRLGWPHVEHMQAGLVDGPGNDVMAYCAAITAVTTLCRRYEGVLIYDHSGGRALAVAAMYLNLVGGKFRPEPLSWSHWLSWEERIAQISKGPPARILLPTVHEAHRTAFADIPYGLLEALL